MQLLGALIEYLKVRKMPSDYFASTLGDVGLVGRVTVNAIAHLKLDCVSGHLRLDSKEALCYINNRVAKRLCYLFI